MQIVEQNDQFGDASNLHCSSRLKNLKAGKRNFLKFIHATKPIGVVNNGQSYSSLSMGAGEQRIFYILSEIIGAPNFGLILIDEIDLLLHEDALTRLLKIINELA